MTKKGQQKFLEESWEIFSGKSTKSKFSSLGIPPEKSWNDVPDHPCFWSSRKDPWSRNF